MAETTFRASHGESRAYLARPDGTGPWPGVIVLHDVFGMTADLRRQCDWLAGAGYLALAPDLYSWGRKITCIRSTMNDLKNGRGRAFDDIDAARARLVGDEDCTGTVGVIGYCMSGGFSLLLAAGGHYSASSVNYGHLPDDPEAVLAGACPIVGSFGGRDRELRGAAAKLESALDANDVPHDVKEYPAAGHGFLNDHDGAVGVLIAVVGRLVGVGYHEPAAVDARARIIDFFDRHLKDT